MKMTPFYFTCLIPLDDITEENGQTEFIKGREDVRGVAGVAFATPFFQDLFYMPSRLLAIWSSGHPAI